MSEQNNTEMAFQIQRIYTKDVSFEAPNGPKVFQQEWQPEIKLDLDTASSQLAEEIYEVVLRVTVTATLGGSTAFLCEVHQAGIFTISGINDTQMVHCLGAYCPNILFPYARECITSQVSRGTFPQLNLAPVNFDALFMNYLQQQTDGEGSPAGSGCLIMPDDASMVVIGAGSYGTALAIALARNGHKVLLWGHDPAHIQALEAARCNQAFLPNVPFPPMLRLEASLSAALAASRDVLIVVPSHVFGSVLAQLKPHLRQDARIVWATKGLEVDTGRPLQEVVREVLGHEIPLAVVSGPTFAHELAAGLPTAIALAATDATFGADLQRLLHCGKSFRVYSNPDLIGVQLGGAVKNVIAIGAGISDGIGFGANARAALITRGLAEMSRLGTAMGAESSTFVGMAGLGDLVLTCTDNQSRNRRFGMLLGQGAGVEDAQEKIGQVVEGYRNTKEVLALANRCGVEMPITEQIYQVLYQNKNAHQAALALLGYAQKDEMVSG